MSATIQRTCPRCGADGRGAAWCPSCGLNLRTRETPAAEPTPPPPSPPERRTPVAAIAAVIAGLAVVAVVVAIAAGGQHDASPLPPEPTATVTQEATLITPEAMQDVVARFQQAYDAEDIDALTSLFSASSSSADATLAAFGRRFSEFEADYALSGVQYGDGLATASWTLSNAQGASTGSISFSFVAGDGEVLIDNIAVTP